MFRRYRIRQAAIAEWNAHQGDLRALLGGLHSLAYEIVIEGNKRANQETILAGNASAVAPLPTTASAIPILLILQVIQIIVWLYIQWANRKSPPQENDRGEEAAIYIYGDSVIAATREPSETYYQMEDIARKINQTDPPFTSQGSDGGHIQPTEPQP